MRDDGKNAMVDVMASLVGDVARARVEVEKLDPVLSGGIDRFAILFDLADPGPARQRALRQFGPRAETLLRQFLPGRDGIRIEGDLAVFGFGPPGHGAGAPAGSAILMHQHAVDFIAATDFPDIALTRVELRLIFLLLAGLELRDIARIDRVGYETRRGQFKTLASKLGLSRQAELTRMFLGRLLVLLGRAEMRDGDDRHRIFFETMGHPELAGVRPFVMTGPNGQTIRLVEMGPKTGRPVIVLHPMAFPVTSAAEVRAFHDHGIRAIWPIRSGALCARGALIDPDKQRAASLADIALIHDLFCDAPTMLVGLMSGATYAIDAAQAMPDRVGALCLVGACYKPVVEGMSGGALRRGLFNLARDNPGIMMTALRVIAARIARPTAYAPILRRHYRASPGDLAIIGRSARDGTLDRMLQNLTTSLASMRNDFFLQAEFEWSALDGLPQPVHFIHGEQDPFHPVAAIQALAGTLPGSGVRTISDAGQLLLHHHFAAAVGVLAEILADRPGGAG